MKAAMFCWAAAASWADLRWPIGSASRALNAAAWLEPGKTPGGRAPSAADKPLGTLDADWPDEELAAAAAAANGDK